MIRVELPQGRVLGLSFSHLNRPPLIEVEIEGKLRKVQKPLSKAELKRVPKRATACALFELPDGDPAKAIPLHGPVQVECSKLDNYVKEVGRKSALSTLLSQAGIDKDTRIHIWKAYAGAVKHTLVGNGRSV